MLQRRLTNEVDVIAGENRKSFALGRSEHASVKDALFELGSNSLVREVLEGILGHNPALMELQIIISYAGADDQFWHADTPPERSATRFADDFGPLYTMLIPLQDTTPSMGATAVCPGTHRCHFTFNCSGLDDESTLGFRVSNSDGIWPAGDAMLYSSTTQHRGTSHLGGAPRVALLLSWTTNRGGLWPPLDTVYAVQELGMTLTTLTNPTVLGGWSARDMLCYRIVNPGQYRFRIQDLEKQIQRQEGPLGIASTVLGIQSVERPPRGFAPMEYHLLRLIGRARLLLGATAAWLSFYLLLDGDMRRFIRTPMALGLLIIVAFYFSTRQLVGNLDWSPVRSNLHTPDISRSYLETLSTPKAKDVLVVDHDAGYGCFLVESHPGNLRWESVLQSVASYWIKVGHTAFREAAIRYAISQAISDRGRRVLRLNELGDWILLTESETLGHAKDLVRRALIGESLLFPTSTLSRVMSSIKTPKMAFWHPYHDTHTLRFVPSRMVQPMLRTRSTSNTSITIGDTAIRRGDNVEALLDYGKSRQWLSASIVEVISDLYFDVKFFDLEETTQKGVHREFIRVPYQQPNLGFSQSPIPASRMRALHWPM